MRWLRRGRSRHDDAGHTGAPGDPRPPEASQSTEAGGWADAQHPEQSGHQDARDIEDNQDTVELHLTTVGGSGGISAVGSGDERDSSSGGSTAAGSGSPGDGSAVDAGGSSPFPSGRSPALDSTGASVAGDDSVRAARRRFVRRRWARRWLAWRRLVAAVLLVALVAGSVWLVFFSSVLAVSGVRVEGTGVLSTDAVRRVAEVPTGTPLATADLDSVSERVERLPAVESVDVSRSWPDQVRIDVTERRVVAVVAPSRPGDRFRGTDDDGVVFRSYVRRPPGLPLIRMEEPAGAAALAEAAAVSGSLPAAIAKRVSEVRVRTVDTISLSLRDGRTVRWGSVEGSVDKARVLAVLLGQQASSIDVTVPGRPVIRR